MKLLLTILALSSQLSALSLLNAGVIADRHPQALVKVTPAGALITTEEEWRGHVMRVTALKETSGARWQLLEPVTEENSRLLPPSPVPSQGNLVQSVILDGEVRRGLWLQGRTVVIP